MSPSQLRERVRSIIAQVTKHRLEALHDGALLAELDIDSLDIVEVMMVVENEFDLEMCDDVPIQESGSIGEIIDAVQMSVERAQPSPVLSASI